VTALCGGGTSSAKPGFGASVALTASGIGAMLNNIPTAWAIPIAAYLGLVTYDLSTFCTTDPPAVPTITAADFIAVISIADPVAHILAVQKFQQLLGAFFWYQVCQCDSVPTPAAPSPPAAPANLPTVNPPAAVGGNPLSSACATYDSGQFTDATPATSITFGRAIGIGTIPHLAPSPSSSTYVRATWTWTGTSAPAGWQLESAPTDSTAGATIRATGSGAFVSGVTQTITFAGNPDPYWFLVVSANDSGTQTHHGTIEFFCGGTPALPTPNCGCVPDAQSVGLLSSIYQLLTTVQRYKAPFAYIRGATHSGVSGTGATAISRLIGYQLVVTARPGAHRVSGGNPSYIYDLGWVSVSDADGMIEEKRLTRDSMLWFPQLGQLATSFNYFLQSGVTISWTELQPEP
jgi:hypothetical protein